MAKTTAWAFAILGVLSIPPIMAWINTLATNLWGWIFAIIFLVVGVTKLMRNYSYNKR